MMEVMPSVVTNLQATKADDESACSGKALRMPAREMRGMLARGMHSAFDTLMSLREFHERLIKFTNQE